jgi:hypothetical protein
VQGGLQLECVRRAQLQGRDAGGGAPVQEGRPVVHVVVGQGDEQAAVLLERAGGDAAQDAVLLDALDRGLLVGDGVAGSRVEQAVVAAGRARGQLTPLDQGDRQTAEGEVVGERPPVPPRRR